MTTRRQRHWISIGITVVGLIAVTVLVWVSPLPEVLSSADRLRQTVGAYGWLAPMLIIAIHAFQVIVAPIPGQAIDIANGYLFGWLGGSLISLAGIGLGSVIAIWLAKQFGRPLVETLVTPKGMQAIKPYTSRRSQSLFFFLFLLPGTPDDLLCFAIGLSAISLWRAVAIAMLGRAPGVVAAVITGASGHSLNPLMFSLVAIVVSLVFGLIVWKTPLKKKMNIPDLTPKL